MANFFDKFDGAQKQPGNTGNPFDKFDDPNYVDPKRTIGGTIADLGVTAAKAAIGLPEAAVGIADLATGGQAGKLAESAGFRPKEAKDYLSTLYSPAQQAANQEVANAKGFLPTIAAAVQNPSFIVHNALESAPSMLLGAGVARGALAVAPKIGAIAAGAAGEGAVAAGQNAEQVRQEDPNGTLTGKQSAILAASGALTGGISLGAGGLANKLGIGDVSTMLASGKLGPIGADAAATGANKGILRKIGEGAAVEGIGQELPQSYQEQVGQNLAQGKPWDEGAAEAGAQGMLAGGLMGAVGGPLHGHEDGHAADAGKTPVDTVATTPAGPAIDPDAGPLQKAASMVTQGPIDYTPEASTPVPAGGLSLAEDMPTDPNSIDFEPQGFKVQQRANGLDNLQLYASKGQGFELAKLQPMVAQLQAQGEDYSIIPHNDGGYTVAPTKSLTPGIQEAIASLQPQPGQFGPATDPLALPGPDTAAPNDNTLIAGADGVRPKTYADQSQAAATQRAALDAAQTRKDNGESVPFGPNQRLMPFSEAAATKQAAARSEKTGEPYTVVPHPSAQGKFAVVPESTIVNQPGAANDQPSIATDLPAGNVGVAGVAANSTQQPGAEAGRTPVAQPTTERQTVAATPVPTIGKGVPDSNAGVDGQPALAGKKINKAWTTFAPGSGTLNIPRAEMPQIKAEHRGAMVNFLKARGIGSTQEEVPADSLKPTQTEFSPAKVAKAKSFTGGDRSILVSSDNHVLDGHHQWLAKHEAGEPVKIIRLHAPISALLDTVKEFPSVQKQAGSTTVTTDIKPQEQINGTQTPQAIQTETQGQEAPAVVKPGLAKIQAAKAARDAAKIKKPSSGAQVARDRLKAANPFMAFLAENGVNPKDRADVGVEPKYAGMTPGYGPIFKKSAPRLDILAQRAVEAGHLTQADVDNVNDNGGVNKLADMIQRAVVGREVIQPAASTEAAAEQSHGADAQLLSEAASMGIETDGKTVDQVYDEMVDRGTAIIQPMVDDLDIDFDFNAEPVNLNHLTDEEVDALFGIAKTENSGAGNQETAGVDTGSSGQEAAEPAEGFALQGQTAAEGRAQVAADEQRQTATQAEDQRAAEAERKVGIQKEINSRQDASAQNFQLGQSADDSLAGQKDIFSAPAARETVIEPAARKISTETYNSWKRSGQITETVNGWGFAEHDPWLDFGKSRFALLSKRHAVDFVFDTGNKTQKLLAEKTARDWAKEHKPAQYEIEQVEPVEQSGSAGPSPVASQAAKPASGKIQDFGEKLGGAKKDTAPSLSKELSDNDIASQPLSKVWPADEYLGIDDKFASAVTFAARAEVPAKPRTSYKVARWVEKVKTVRSLARKVASGETTRARFAEEMAKVRSLNAFSSKVALLEAIDRAQWGRIGSVEVYPDAYRYNEDGSKTSTPMARVAIDGKSHSFDGATNVAEVVERVNGLLGNEAQAKKMQFEVRGRSGSYSINKKGDKEYRKLKTFVTSKEALEFVRSNHDDLLTAWEGVKARDNVGEGDVRNTENRPRTGADHRNGKDVTAEQFSSTFGFRGIEFGNWVSQGKNAKERQGMLNQAHDALMDLAEIMGVPAKALSLNGTLGLGFGSRGSGKFAAHFESDTLVINLTKTRGAGSLGHEFFHAMDNYFARQRGAVPMAPGMSQQDYRKANYITYKPEPRYVHKGRYAGPPLSKAQLDAYHARDPSNPRYNLENWEIDPKHPSGVRPEVERRFAELVEALDASPMAERAAKNDSGTDGYWGRIIERAARSFENYIISKMMAKGYQNDYLANVREVQDFQRDQGRYPYLLPEEVAPIADAFDNLFGELKTKTDDNGNIALFLQEADSAANPRGLDHKLIRQLANKDSAKAMLATIAAESKNPQYRVLAKSLMDSGIDSTVEFGSPEGQKFDIKNQDRFSFAAAYSPKRDAVILFRTTNVERNLMHEFTHAATYKAIHSNGLASAQMKALYEHVKESDLMGGHYGMENVDEFVAEAFSNPKFQADLQDVPGSRTGGSFKSAWDRLVAIVQQILRIPKANITALDQAMRIGADLMRENAALKQEKTGDDVGLVGNAVDRNSFSGATDMLRSGKTLAETGSLLKSLLSSDKRFNFWDRTIGTQFGKAKKDADFNRVFQAVQQQVDDTAHFAIEAEQFAPSVLQRLDSIKDIAKALGQGSAKHKADMTAVGKALFSNIEGEKGVQQKVFSNDELRKDFGLTDGQIETYRQVRKTVDTSIDRLAQSTIAAMGQAAGMDVAHLKDATLETTAQAVKDGTDDGVVGKNISGTMPTKNAELHERIDELVQHSNELQAAGYMPAMRFGQYAVTVTDPAGGDPLHFQMFESQFAANVAANQLKKDYPGMTVDKSVMNPDAFAMFKGVSPETVELFAKFSGMDETQAYKDYIALAKAGRSSMKRMLERKGIAGFSEDTGRVLAQFITSNARQTALNVNGSEVTSALAAVPKEKGDVQREAQRLVHYMQNPQEEAQRLRGFLFTNYIGGSLASAAVNLTQPVLQTGPFLSQYAGAKTVAIMARSAKMAANGNISNAELRAAMDRAREDGITDPHEIHNLMADAGGSSLGSSLKMRAAMKAWGSFFALSEAYNRRLTFLAAYQTAMDMDKAKLSAAGFENAYDFAKNAIIETQGLYSKANRPNWARGAIGATLFTFKQFSISYIEFLNRLPNKQKAIALAMLVLASGLQGLPFAEDIEDMIDTIGESLGYATNSKKALREKMAALLGDTFGDLATHGVSGKTGIDLQGRLGMGNLIPGTGMFKMSTTDKGQDALDLVGPFGGLVQSFQKATAKAQAGHIMGNTGALAEMAPVAIKNALQGIEMASTGAYSDSKDRKVMGVTMGDAAAKFFGFQPSAVAKESRIVSDLYQDRSLMQAVKSGIVERWASAAHERDFPEVQKVMAKLKQWNADNPESQIQVKPDQIKQRVQQMNQSRQQRFVKALPKQMHANAMKELQK